jgi:hypothetical protein
MNFRAPENFVRHPITNSGKSVLHEDDGFNRCLAMSIQELIDEFLVELSRSNFGNIARPPAGRLLSLMEAHATKLTRIGENQRAFALIQDQVIVLVRVEIRRPEVNFAGHAEMKAEPVVAGKFKQHSFPPRGGSQQLLADQFFA